MRLLPKRAAPYIIALLLVVLLALTVWLYQALTSPEIREAVRKRAESRANQP